MNDYPTITKCRRCGRDRWAGAALICGVCQHADEQRLKAAMSKPLEHREDGWPICPVCDEDELGAIHAPLNIDKRLSAGEYHLHDLFCYRCGMVTVKAGWE